MMLSLFWLLLGRLNLLMSLPALIALCFFKVVAYSASISLNWPFGNSLYWYEPRLVCLSTAE